MDTRLAGTRPFAPARLGGAAPAMPLALRSAGVRSGARPAPRVADAGSPARIDIH